MISPTPGGGGIGRTKLTLRLSSDAYAATLEAVRLGLAPNRNAFIEDAIRRRAREIRHERMARLAEEALADPGFVADMRATMQAYRHADAEGWPPPFRSPRPVPIPAKARAGRSEGRA